MVFTPTADYNGAAASVQIVTNDLGNTGSGGAQSDTDTVNITVNAVNDAPVNTMPPDQATPVNITLVMSSANGNNISIGDVDAGGSNVRVTLTATDGKLTLATIAGLSFTVGTGTLNTTMTFTGTIAAINTALDGMSFVPTAGFAGIGTLSVTTDDLGNSGSGGALSDSDTIQVEMVSETRVNTTTSSTQYLPQVAADEFGDYVVVWVSNGTDGSGYGVYAQRFDYLGNKVGSEFRVNQTTANDQ